MKLLSPAGDFESLKMAIFYGADEVYLGIKNFNARNIEGFSLESLKDAVDFAHIYDVKVNLAVNILFSNNELQDALNLVVDAYNLGVDAFIIQDLGLASIINQNYPEIETTVEIASEYRYKKVQNPNGEDGYEARWKKVVVG